MGLPELKSKVLMYVENADESFLQAISNIIDNQEDYKSDEILQNVVSEPIVAYDVMGKPLKLKEYITEIDKGILDFENGRTISHENLRIEIESWRN